MYDWWGFVDDALAVVEVPATFLTGIGDSFSFGLTEIARERMWGEEAAQIHYQGVYRVGEWTEVAIEIGVTGGGALLKRAASKAVAKEAAELGARSVGIEISEAAKRAIDVASAKLKNELRREAREIAAATKGEIVHHINTLVGHPPYRGRGPVRSAFPTLGVRWLANNKRNLMTIAKSSSATHARLHQRAYLAEELIVTVYDPALTIGRIGRNWLREIELDFDVRIK